MRACYGELGRPPGAPLATWQDAFKRHGLVVLMDQVDTSWSPWSFDFPEDARVPGDLPVPLFPDVWDYVQAALEWLEHHFETHPALKGRHPAPPPKPAASFWQVLTGDMESFGREVERAVRGVITAVEDGAIGHELTLAVRYAEVLMGEMTKSRHHHLAIAKLLRDFHERLRKRVEPDVGNDVELRRAWILLSLGLTMVIGMLEDGVVTGGFEMIEGEEWTAWLRRHGANDLTANSALVRGLYDLVFGFEKGDPERRAFAAGTAMRSAMSVVFEYRGAIFWKMQAGMGDTVFGPFYEVLKRRGVRFEFFHEVQKLELSDDGKSIRALQIGRQVWLRDHEKHPECEYAPLIDVKGLPCWPSTPRYELLDEKQAAELIARGIDLESPNSGWEPCEVRTLTAGKDFHVVVLAIPPGAQHEMCGDLIATNAAFRSMVDRVKTVATQAAQLWLCPDLAGLGWQGGSPVLDAYADCLNTWADMSHLIPREDWPDSADLHNIAYFCGPLKDMDGDAARAESDDACTDRVKKDTVTWMDAHTGALWPKATAQGNPVALNYEHLVAAPGAQGIARMEQQYFRANVEGSERYVLSVPGSAFYRLKAGASGLKNLFLAGDWVDNGFLNAGCIEAATMSGMQAARAISGFEHEIAWEKKRGDTR
jgi:uncharacterized protein with NAD-binding domain and iron-sulfur cluster